MARIRIYESEGYPYCIREEVSNGGHVETITDSQKIDWPFDCEDLTLLEATEQCEKHFPDDEIE